MEIFAQLSRGLGTTCSFLLKGIAFQDPGGLPLGLTKIYGFDFFNILSGIADCTTSHCVGSPLRKSSHFFDGLILRTEIYEGFRLYDIAYTPKENVRYSAPDGNQARLEMDTPHFYVS